MNKLDQNKLAELLITWFKHTNNNRNRWNNNKIGKILKNQLQISGNWKKNGNRAGRRALAAMKYAVAVREGYKGPPQED
jgi:hypothetical protein